MGNGDTKLWLTAAVMLVVAMGCSGDDDAHSDDTAGAGGPGSGELAAAVLTLDDMPDGWVDLGRPTPEICGMRSDMDPATDEQLPSGSAAFAAAGGAVVPDVFEIVVAAPEGRGEDVFGGVRRFIGQCGSGEVDGLLYTGTEPLVVPAIGDQFVGRRITATDQATGAVIGVDLLYARAGDLIVGIGVVEPAGDTARLVELASLAFERATAGD